MASSGSGLSGSSRQGKTQLRRRPQLSEDVAGILRHRIMSGAIRPGQFIRMDETATELGVSVTPVREALLTLRGEGMVNLAPHRGYVVGDLTREDIADIFWLQGTIAVELAVRSADDIDEQHLLDLEARTDVLAATVDTGGASDIALAEFEFHRAVNRLVPGTKLAWFLHHSVKYTPYELYAADPAWGAVAVDSHRRLIAAYRSGDRDQIIEQTRRQFTDGAERLIAHLEQTGIWD